MAPGTLRTMTARFADSRGDDSANRTDRLQQDRRADLSAAVRTNGRSPRSSGGYRATDEPSYPAAVDGQTRCPVLAFVMAGLAVPVLVLVAVLAMEPCSETSAAWLRRPWLRRR